MHMQKGNRRARLGRWLLLLWALAVLAAMLIDAPQRAPEPAYDGATFVRAKVVSCRA